MSRCGMLANDSLPSPEEHRSQNSWLDRLAEARMAGLAFPDLAILIGLVVSILAVYAQTAQFDFVNFDDGLYVYQNPNVQAGLTLASIRSAWTAVVSSNWQPVTLLSYMLDVSIFGVDSGMIHVMNVVYHALSAALLFLVLKRATRARAPSAFVAFVFALHPLHVESVAWISERKDVLSTLFLFLALYAYVRYTERPGAGRYLLMLAFFCLGLMSKSMLVTFPFLLLLVDYWPLRRVQLPKIIWEKIPLFALAGAASVTAYVVQRSTGALAEAIPFAGRIAKALLSYVTYVRQTFWPAGLAVFYPYPRYIEATTVGAALAILLVVSALVIFNRRIRPYLAMGWFWYVGTLVPVIGLVKIGDQSHADRYTYVPMVGLLIMLAWGSAEVVGRWPQAQFVIGGLAVACCGACLVLSLKQTSYWQNDETLYRHAIEVTGENWLAESNLGAYLMDLPNRGPEAVEHLQIALRIKPDNAETNNNMGLCLAKISQCGEAIPYFEAALRFRPSLVAADNNLGMCLTATGDYPAAISRLETALRIQPDYAEAHFNLANALSKVPGRELEAAGQYEDGLRLRPDDAVAHRNLGILLEKLGRTEEAISHFEAAERVQPDVELSNRIRELRLRRK